MSCLFVLLSTLIPTLLFCLSSQEEKGPDPYTGSPTFGHLTRLENELKPEERRYLRDLSSRFDDLWEYFGEAEKQRKLVVESDPAARQYPQAKRDYSSVLNQFSRSANGLRQKMLPLLPGMEDKKALEWTGSQTSTGQPYREEMEFMRSTLREAELRFRGRYTKGVVYTEGENILIRLYWLEQMAKRLRRELDG